MEDFIPFINDLKGLERLLIKKALAAHAWGAEFYPYHSCEYLGDMLYSGHSKAGGEEGHGGSLINHMPSQTHLYF